MKVIAVANQKGGCGKTTIALHLSGAMAADGHSVLLIDADPQASAATWSRLYPGRNEGFDILPSPSAALHQTINSGNSRLTGLTDGTKSYRYVLIDCPPGGARSAASITASALQAAHLAIVPIQPSPLDFWSAAAMWEMVEEARRFNSKLDARLLICRKISHTAEAEDARQAARQNLRFPLFKAELTQRILCVRALGEGKTVVHLAPESQAAKEFTQLSQEVIRCLE
jgi:chromosome partitioning protein